MFGMSSWLLLRVLSKGLFLNPHAAISSVWDILDWIFLIVSKIISKNNYCNPPFLGYFIIIIISSSVG